MARGEVLSGACAYFGAARRLIHCVRGRTDRWTGREGRSDCASKRAVACKKRAKWGSQIVRCLLQECRVMGAMTRDATTCTSVMNGGDERLTARAEWLVSTLAQARQSARATCGPPPAKSGGTMRIPQSRTVPGGNGVPHVNVPAMPPSRVVRAVVVVCVDVLLTS